MSIKYLRVGHSYHLRVWEIHVGWFSDPPDIDRGFHKNQNTASREFYRLDYNLFPPKTGLMFGLGDWVSLRFYLIFVCYISSVQIFIGQISKNSKLKCISYRNHLNRSFGLLYILVIQNSFISFYLLIPLKTCNGVNAVYVINQMF